MSIQMARFIDREIRTLGTYCSLLHGKIKGVVEAFNSENVFNAILECCLCLFSG